MFGFKTQVVVRPQKEFLQPVEYVCLLLLDMMLARIIHQELPELLGFPDLHFKIGTNKTTHSYSSVLCCHKIVEPRVTKIRSNKQIKR